MSYSVSQIRNERTTPIWGRRLALDRRDFILGPAGIRLAVEDLGTIGTTVSYNGITRVRTSGSSQGPTQHNLPVPAIGQRKTVVLTSTSTGSAQFLSTPNGAAIISSLGSTTNAINLVGPGGGFTLLAVSASEWAIESVFQPASVTVTTST